MSIFAILLRAISPELRKIVVEFILSLKKKAAATDNPLDDIIVDILIQLLDIKE